MKAEQKQQHRVGAHLHHLGRRRREVRLALLRRICNSFGSLVGWML
jgi:hypothetical protein